MCWLKVRGWCRSTRFKCRLMSDEQKLEAHYALWQNMWAAGVAGLDLQRAAPFNILAE